MGDSKGEYRVLAEKIETRRQLGRPRHKWEDNMKMDLREMAWGGGGMDWIDLAQGRRTRWALVNAVMKLWVPPQNAESYWSG
jgi:hypothetical protein